MSSHSPNYTTVEAFIAHVLATWARQKGRFTTEKFNAGLWEIIKGLLEEFVQHMEDKAARGLIDVLGANCDNVFWDHRDDSKAYLKDFTEQDRVTCRIMSAALTFMSTVRDAGQLGQTRNETDKDMRQILGCTVMHVFASILRSTTCAATSNGINYAWRTMKRVDAGFRDTAGAGALASARCEKGGWKGLTIGSGQIRTAVDAWLSHNTDLWTKLRQLHGNENCRRNKSNNDELATGAKVGQGAGVTGSAGIAKEIVTVVKDVFDKMKDDVIEKSKSSPALPGAGAAKPAATNPATTKPPTKGDNPQDKKKEDIPAPPAPGGVARADGSAAEDVAKSPPATGGTPAGQGPGPGQQPPPPPPPQQGTDADKAETLVSFGTSSGTEDECGKKPEDPQEGEHVKRSKDASEPARAGSTIAETTDKDGGAHASTPIHTQPTPTPSTGTETAGTGATTGTSGDGAKGDPGTAQTVPVAPDTTAPKPHDDDRATKGTDIVSAANGDNNTDPFGSADYCMVDGKKKDDDSEQCHAIIGGGRRAASTRTGAAGAPTGPSGQAERGGAAGVSGTGGLELGIELPEGKSNVGGSYGPGTPQDPHTPQNTPTSPSPDVPDLTGDILTATTPVLFFLSAVTVALLGYSLWKYFAYLGQTRRRTYRTVRDVPSPPLDEEILEHLQRGELPPPDYGYKMIKDTHPASTSGTGRPPRVHKRTIIELDLEVLHECEATEWESVKDDYLQIVVEECAQELMRDVDTNNSILHVPNSHASVTTHDSTTDHSTTLDSCRPNEEDPDPCKCTETILLATEPCRPTEEDPDPCSCMETIHTDTEQSPSTGCGHATSECTQWINWIDRHKHILRECTTQPWFLQLKADWKQYLRDHMAANEDNGVSAHSEFGEAATLDRKKLDAWKEWVSQQHRQMSMYGQEEWFKHLLNSVEAETVPGKRAVPGVATDVEVQQVMVAEDILRVKVVPWSQLHPQLYLNKPLCAKTWILLLALVIEQCEVDRSVQEKELYVDDLLEKL
ncbi:hypothetical protein AK88_04686 [Plasmodium fragile]|uniref:Schizont-infected cell agglutination C-terminal domain-containing protein n=1 Tax=Plasmodium fragile TaxID=5857 RepID=A0A0D9QF50_PLAFR|nr:uncharacterized protein AK88_04686 [Plasmodium fragile]KJP85655.1 hypothetical protein AK88_04686 [Plasmodium fragile]